MLRAAPRLMFRWPMVPLQVFPSQVSRPSRAAHKLLIALMCIIAVGAQAPLESQATVSAQAADEPRLIVPLHGSTLRYRTLPSAPITAELSDADGGRAEGFGFSGPDGWGNVSFGGGDVAVLKPGKTLLLSRPGADPLEVTIPILGAAVDAMSDRVYGTATSGMNVGVIVAAGAAGEPIEREVTANAAGQWSLELSGELDLISGEAAGSATIDDGDGALFVAAFHDLSLNVNLNTRGLRGKGTAGNTVALRVISEEAERSLGPLVVNVAGEFNGMLTTGDPLSAGDVVEARVVSAAVEAPAAAVVSGTLPALSVNMNPAANAISGSAPAGTVLHVAGDALSGGSGAWTAVAGEDGTWSIQIMDTDLGPGWRVRASLAVAPGLRVGAITVVEQARIGVAIPFIQGVMEPGSTVTFTLRASDGTVKRTVPATANDRGDYSVAFDSPFSPAPVVPEPGDRVEIAVLQDDPVVVNIPALTASPDTDANLVQGTAPPGGTVRIVVQDGTAAGATSNATAGPDGRYKAMLEEIDLQRPASGVVELEHGSGNTLYTSWAAIKISATLGNNFQPSFVNGNGVPGRWVKVELIDPDGRVVAANGGPVSGGMIVLPGFVGGGAQFFLPLRDITGESVNMRPGDTLRVTSGEEVVEITIPPLDAVILVQADTITGTTAPGAEVTITVSQAPPAIAARVTVTADAAGNWTHTFGPELDLLFGDLLQLIAEIDEHLFMQFVLAPGLLLDADQALILGSLAPDIGIIVTLTRDGRTLSGVRSGTAPDGALMVNLTDETGAPLAIEAGDEITVVPMGGAGDVLRLTVPELTINWDIATDYVGGTAGDGSLILFTMLAYPRAGTFGIAQAWPAIDGAGTYDARFAPRPDVLPGMRILALHRPPSGNYVVRQRVVPILSAEIGGPNACGYGVPRASVSGELMAADGAEVGAFNGLARFDGYFAEIWESEDQPLATAAGQQVSADIESGAAPPAVVTLPELSFMVDEDSGLLFGTGPPNTSLLVGEATRCIDQEPSSLLNISIGFGLAVQSDADGNFVAPLIPGLVEPESGIEVSLYVDDDHRAYRQYIQPMARLFLGEDRVEGRAAPLAALDFSLVDADGRVRGGASIGADPAGDYVAAVADEDGDPVLIRPDDILNLSLGDLEIAILAENVDFDWSPGSDAIEGTAPVWRAVQLELRFASGAIISVPRQGGEGGRFSFGHTEVPPRAPWSMDDVIGVRATIEVEGGHEVVRQTPSFTGEPSGPADRTIFLPWGYSNRTSGAAGPAGDSGTDGFQVATPLNHAQAHPSPAEMHDAFGAILRLEFAPQWPPRQLPPTSRPTPCDRLGITPCTMAHR